MKFSRLPLLLVCLCLLVMFGTGEAVAAEVEYLTYDEAVTAVRAALVAREETVTVYVRSDTDLGYNACSELYTLAVAHTGVPNEGDYLRRNMSGCAFDTETTVLDGVYYYTFTLTPNWLATAEQEAEVDVAIQALLNELSLWDSSNYEKITGVYNWITENVQYDFDNLDDDTYKLKYSTYSAIVQKNTVCQGYATLLYRLLLSLDVDCRLISGDGDGESHAWNIVYLDGKYYNVDATWDRDLMGHYRYFLCTEENFGNHTRNSEYDTDEFHARYPMAIAPYVFNVTASGTVKTGMEWVLDGDTGTLTVAGTGAIPSYRYSYAPWYDYRESIQSIVLSEGITEVGERAFYWSTNCTSVTLPDSLIAIREYGFNNLRSLQYITLPENLQIIEFCAFSECAALKSIVLPDSVHTVGSSAFSNCPALTSATLSAGMKSIPSSMFFNDKKLRSVVIPEGITSIGSTAFSDCALRSFHFPATLTSMGTSALSGNSYLKEITVAEGNPSFQSIGGVLFTKDGKTLLCYPAGKYGSYTVPEGTEYIAYGAFRSVHNLTGITFGSTLREIGNYSFSYCIGLYSVTFPANVTKICDSAFRSCTNLKTITFENQSVTLESGGVFAECDSLEYITLPTQIREIPGYLFYGCARLRSVTIPSTAQSIGSSAFLDCDSLTSITVPGSVKSIGQQAFDFCNNLQTIILEEGVQTLGWISIRNAPALTKVVIPDSVTKIEHPYNASSRMFENCPKLVVYVNCGTFGYNYAISNGIDYTATHPYTVSTVYPPSCTAQGYTLYSCRCGLCSYTGNYTGSTGHDYTSSVTAPTCTEEGYTTYTCLACGEWFTDDYVPANGHSYGDWYTITDAFCETEGLEGHDCTVCGHSETQSIPATGHSYSGAICTLCGAAHPEAADYSGKVISILGDSISTFAGYIPTADGFNLEHLARYPQDNLLTDVNETWWMQVIAELDAKLGINDSWRGATVSGAAPVTTGTTGENAAMGNLTRIQNLGSNGTPDVILFYGGTNDLAHVSKVGSFDVSAAPAEVDLTTRKWDNLADAYVQTLLRLQYYYPDAVIIAMLPTYTTSYYSVDKLAQANTVLAQICDYYGVVYVDLRDCGISTADLPDGIHPDATGMDYITDAVLDALLSECDVEAGENVVYSVTHELENAEASLHYYKGVSAGSTFTETISGDNLTVSVTMGGVDITETCYADGVITIADVTGDLVINGKGEQKPIYADHLQKLPEDICSETNLWTGLEHDAEYYTVNGWGVHSSGSVYSVTIPINPGDQLWATSFQASGANGGTINGIRLTWFGETDVLESVSADSVYAEFVANGYLAAPEGAVAVNVVMWNGDSSNEFYILNRPHTPGEPVKENEGDHGSHDLVTYCEICGGELSREHDDGYLPGDINGDGSVNNKDVTRLHRYLSGYDVDVVADALDVNGDGSVNNKDLTRLFRYLSGYDTEIH